MWKKAQQNFTIITWDAVVWWPHGVTRTFKTIRNVIYDTVKYGISNGNAYGGDLLTWKWRRSSCILSSSHVGNSHLIGPFISFFLLEALFHGTKRPSTMCAISSRIICRRSFFAVAVKTPRHFVNHGYRGLSYWWDPILSSEIMWYTRVYQHVKFVEKLYTSDFVCWYTTYNHRHNINQTKHRHFESSPFERCILRIVSESDLSRGTLFHREAEPKTSFSQPWKTVCVTGDIPHTIAKCGPDRPRQQYCSL